MGKKKLKRMPESDSELEKSDSEEMEEGFMNVHNSRDVDLKDDSDYSKENNYDDDDDDMADEEEEEEEDDDQSDGESEDQDDENSDIDDNEIEGDDLHNAIDVQKEPELEELQKEYKQLQNEEQGLLGNLKRHKDEELQKGQAVKNQRALWDKTLEFRFLLQKSFTSSNRLPQEPVKSLFCDADGSVGKAYSDLITSSKKTLDSILELQKALVANNPSITQIGEANSTGKSGQLEATGNNGDVDDEWLRIAQMQSSMAFFRNKSIDKWHRKTQVTTGAAAIKGKLHAFNQSISEQVSSYMRDPSKMIKGMQQNKSAVAVFGNVPDSNDSIKQEDALENGDPELLDDSEFYQQLLKEFFETIDPSSSEMAYYAIKRLQTKKRKIVDRRASKSRKIRYHVHEKIVNFMTPRPMNLPPMAPKLFENLFGLRTQKPSSGA